VLDLPVTWPPTPRPEALTSAVAVWQEAAAGRLQRPVGGPTHRVAVTTDWSYGVVKGVGAAGGPSNRSPFIWFKHVACRQLTRGRAPQALLRQRDLELEERGKLLYKTKARLLRRRALPDTAPGPAAQPAADVAGCACRWR